MMIDEDKLLNFIYYFYQEINEWWTISWDAILIELLFGCLYTYWSEKKMMIDEDKILLFLSSKIEWWTIS